MTIKGRSAKSVTLKVDLAEARDLLERVPRACVAFTGDGGPQVEPVTVLSEAGRYLVGIPSSAAGSPTAGDEVVLVVDDGVQFFDLRAVYVRGYARSPSQAERLPGGNSWLEVDPARVVAWDYARIREVEDES